MKTRTMKFPLSFLTIIVLMIAGLSLVACTSTTAESLPEKIGDQQNDVITPTIETEVVEMDEKEVAVEAYPDTNQETQNQKVDVLSQDSAYPAPEVDIVSQVESVDTQEEAYPSPPEEPLQEIKPTPRGNELVATNPSTVNLASGQLQLVELFAFW